MLSIVGVAESTYYDRKKKERHHELHPPDVPPSMKRGRPIPGYSYTKTGNKVPDEQIEEWLFELLAGEEHVYGYEKLAVCLREQYQLILNDKKAYRLCKKLDILQPQRQVKPKHPRRLAMNREITAPNQLWQCDIKYGHLAEQGRFFFVLSFIDVFDRSIVGYYRGGSCEGKHAVQALREALVKRNIHTKETMPVIRTDNGPQFVSHVFEQACETLGIHHERIPPKCPDKNAYIESFHSQLERDLFQKEEFLSSTEAYTAVDRYMDFYNNRRIHRSIQMLSPSAFFTAWQEKKTKPQVIKV